MPLSSTILAPTLAVNLAAVLHIGTGMPRFAKGIANGVVGYLEKVSVTTVDTGTLGVGTSLTPLVIVQQALLNTLLIGFAAQEILGPLAPFTAQGISNGLALGVSALAFQKTDHPTVGSGTGVMRITGGSAIPFMIQGFKDAGLSGEGSRKQATAIGIGLDIYFAAFVMPIPIVGPASTFASAGVGSGRIV